jgi:DNA mismatch endonuclease, patch repair protein
MKESAEERSRIMRAVKGADTVPEIKVRRLAHRMGYRFRLCRKDLPGKPDLVFPRFQKVVFIHGCFWHGHDCPRGARVPAQNRAYWIKKIARNRERDQVVQAALKIQGWDGLVIWECELKNSPDIEARLRSFLKRSGTDR